MAGLPRLPSDDRQKLQLLLDGLKEQYGFTPEWLEREKAAQAKLPHFVISFVKPDGTTASRMHLKGELGSQGFTNIDEEMGRVKTKNLARELFGLLAEMYYSKRKPYQKYCGLLNTIRSTVVRAMRKLWRYRGRNWFNQMYLKDVNDVLDTAIVYYRNKARAAKLRPEPKSPSRKTGKPRKVRKRVRLKTSSRDAPTPQLRRGYRQEVNNWKKDLTIPQAAHKLGVGESVLKSIMSSKGRLRCSPETRDATLKKWA
jgi:hypothetical protein